MRGLIILSLLMSASALEAQISSGFDAGVSDQVERNIEEANQRPPVDVLGSMDERAGAQLYFLDRLNGLVKKFALAEGETTALDYLSVRLDSCFSPQDRSNNDAAAFLEIDDTRDSAPQFRGWMIASAPALSALEHHRYDIWVDRCLVDMADANLEITAP